MEPPRARLRVAGADVLLLGTIQGFVPDGQRVQDAWAGHRPDLLALGIPPEDLEGLATLHAAPETPLPEPDPQTERLFEHLEAWGGTQVPSPDLAAAYQAARAGGVPVAALDMDDEAHSSLYVKTVGFRHAVRSGRLLKKVLRAEFDAEDPYTLTVAWDAFQTRSKPLRAVEEAREVHIAARLKTEADGRARVLAVVPVARFDGVVDALE